METVTKRRIAEARVCIAFSRIDTLPLTVAAESRCCHGCLIEQGLATFVWEPSYMGGTWHRGLPMTIALHARSATAAAARTAARDTSSDTASDEALIKRIARGDQLAMRTLYARHRIPIYRWLLRIVRDETVAEDILSEVFLAVWRKAGSFEGRASVSTWLLAIARYK